MQSCEIKYALHCDHSSVSMDIQIQAQRSRAPGFWHFNSSLLEEKDFTDDLTEKIPLFMEKFKNVEDRRLLWEMIKMEIRMFTMAYSKQKAKNIRNLEENLSKEAHRLQKVAEKSLEPEDIKKYDNVKTKLDRISFVRARGARVRSKARWHEFGERSSKYFLNLDEKIEID